MDSCFEIYMPIFSESTLFSTPFQNEALLQTNTEDSSSLTKQTVNILQRCPDFIP